MQQINTSQKHTSKKQVYFERRMQKKFYNVIIFKLTICDNFIIHIVSYHYLNILYKIFYIS